MNPEDISGDWLPSDLKVLHNEDNVPVQTIYVTGLQPKTKKELLQNYFETNFGFVSAIRIHKNFKPSKITQRPKKFAFAFVTFATPEAAAKAIQQRNHSLSGKRMKVFAADNWHQPKDKPKESTKVSSLSETSSTTADDVSLLKLDDYCLLHICKYLSAIDVTRLSMTCSRLCGIAELIFRNYSKFNFTTDTDKLTSLTLGEVRMLTARIGRYIKELTISGDDILRPHQRYINVILKACPILDWIRMIRIDFMSNSLKKRLGFRAKLKTLILENCTIYDRTLSELFSSPLCSLQRIKLIKCRQLDGSIPLKLNTLEDLHIESIQLDESFVVNCLKNSFLKRLTIKRVLFNDLTLSQDYDISHLEYLKLDVNPFGELTQSQMSIAQRLSNLKCLLLPWVNSDVSAALGHFAVTNQLEELDISAMETPPNFLRILAKMTNLRLLKVDRCTQIDEANLIKLATKHNWRHFSCGEIEFSEAGYTKIVELSENLEHLEARSITVVAIHDIIYLLNEQKHRPKLKIVVWTFDDQEARDVVTDMELSNSTRIKILVSKDNQVVNRFFDDNNMDFSDDNSESYDSDSDEHDDDNVLNNPRNYVITDSEDEMYNL